MAITPNPDSDPLPNPSTPSGTPRATRPARALIGWMAPEDAHPILNGCVAGAPVSLEHARRAQQARDAVAARASGLRQVDVVEAAPKSLDGHISAVMASPPAAPFRDEGWEVRIVDLSQVVALQPVVHTDHGVDRVASIEPDDLHGMIPITLPLPSDAQLPYHFDTFQRAWVISSANPNLRIQGPWAGQVEPGVLALGLCVTVWPSYMQVARIRGRYVLRDGYHRAVAFLRQGISEVPALVRDIPAFDDLGVPPGLLAPAIYLGERPPILTDYLDDAVAADVEVPASQKLVVVNGLELNPAA